MKVVFVVLYGLLGLVRTDKELWVLIPDAEAMHYSNGTHGEGHHPEIAVRKEDEKFARVVSLMGDDVEIGSGAGGSITYHREQEIVFLKDIPVKARVDPNCIGPAHIDDCKTAEDTPLLAGRVRLVGPGRVGPFFVMRNNPNFPMIGLLVRNTSQARDWRWGFRYPDRTRRFGTHEGAFGGAMVAAVKVDGGYTSFNVGGKPIPLEPVNGDLCALYAGDLGMSDAEKTDVSTNGCYVVWISNQPIPIDAKQELPVARVHTELLFDLLADKRQQRAVPYRIEQAIGGAGDPPGSVCIGGIMEEK